MCCENKAKQSPQSEQPPLLLKANSNADSDSESDYLSSDEDMVFQNAICRKRILRRTDHSVVEVQDTCCASSKSSGTRFRKRVASNRKASIDISMCDANMFEQFVLNVKQEADDQSQCRTVQRKLTAKLLSCEALLEKISTIPNEVLQPDVWTLEVVNHNGFEPRQFGTFVLRPCSNGEMCLSRYIRHECDCKESPVLAECLNADALKKLIVGNESENDMALQTQQFGCHPCILCRTHTVNVHCMDPTKESIVTLQDYLETFSFDFIDFHKDYMIPYQLVVKETGIKLNYNGLKLNAAMNKLHWEHQQDNVHRIDFTPLSYSDF